MVATLFCLIDMLEQGVGDCKTNPAGINKSLNLFADWGA